MQISENFTYTAHLNAGNNYTDAWDRAVDDFLYDVPVDTNFFFTLYATIRSTGEVLADNAALSLSLPSLNVTAPPVIHINTPTGYSVSFVNPLSSSLTNVVVRIRTIDMGADVTLTIDTIAGGGSININRQLLASADAVGLQSILVVLFCDQFDYLDGYTSVQVLP